MHGARAEGVKRGGGGEGGHAALTRRPVCTVLAVYDALPRARQGSATDGGARGCARAGCVSARRSFGPRCDRRRSSRPARGRSASPRRRTRRWCSRQSPYCAKFSMRTCSCAAGVPTSQTSRSASSRRSRRWRRRRSRPRSSCACGLLLPGCNNWEVTLRGGEGGGRVFMTYDSFAALDALHVVGWVPLFMLAAPGCGAAPTACEEEAVSPLPHSAGAATDDEPASAERSVEAHPRGARAAAVGNRAAGHCSHPNCPKLSSFRPLHSFNLTSYFRIRLFNYR